MKKIISLIIVALLLLGIIIPASAAGIDWGAAHDSVSRAAGQYYDTPIWRIVFWLKDFLRGCV